MVAAQLNSSTQQAYSIVGTTLRADMQHGPRSGILALFC